MLQHSAEQAQGKKNQQILMNWQMNIYDLAYHGLRAKDKSFNATLKTDFDETHWQHQYHSAGYWKSVIEFIQQCILCSE